MTSTAGLESSLSATSVEDRIGIDDSLVPRVNRRRPFDLHWRRDPTEWRGRISSAYRRNHRQPHGAGTGTGTGKADGAEDPLIQFTTDGVIAYWWCPRCGSVACPLDPHQLVASASGDGKQSKQGSNAELVLRLANEKKDLTRQLDETQKLLETALRLQREYVTDKEQMLKRLAEREQMCKLLERERSSLIKEVTRLHIAQNQTNEDSCSQKKQHQETDEGQKPPAVLSFDSATGNHVAELACLQEAIEALKVEVGLLRDDKESVERLLGESDAKLAIVERQLITSNDELLSLKEGNNGNTTGNRGKPSVSASKGGSLQQLEEDDQLPLLPYTNNARDVFLIGSSGAAGGVVDSAADRLNLRQAMEELTDEKQRRLDTEREADKLLKLLNDQTIELEEMRTERSRLADELAAAVRANEEAAREMTSRNPELGGDIELSRLGISAAGRRQAVDSFERFVVLTRQLNDARELNEKLKEELLLARAKKGDLASPGRRTFWKAHDSDDHMQHTIVEETTFVIDTSGCRGSLRTAVRPGVKAEAVKAAVNRSRENIKNTSSASRRTTQSCSWKDTGR